VPVQVATDFIAAVLAQPELGSNNALAVDLALVQVAGDGRTAGLAHAPPGVGLFLNEEP